MPRSTGGKASDVRREGDAVRARRVLTRAFPFAVPCLLGELGNWVWKVQYPRATVAAIAAFPVSRRTRLIVALLAALSWPLVYAIKLGQVGPVLLLLFGIGWRWLDRPWPLGLAAGIGSIIKIQPALLIGWALVTGRRRAAAVGILSIGVLAVLFTIIGGTQPWSDWLAVLGRVTRPAIADYDTGIGRHVFVAGASIEVAALVHYLNIAAIIAVTLLVVLRGRRRPRMLRSSWRRSSPRPSSGPTTGSCCSCRWPG